MSTTVNCQDCDLQWEVPDEEVPLGIQDDQLVVIRGRYGTIRYNGICDKCKGVFRSKQIVEEDEFLQLYRIRDQIRRAQPELSLERVCTLAAEIVNDPRRESSVEYRRVLLEWTPQSVPLPQWIVDEMAA